MIDTRTYNCPIRLWDIQIQAMITRTELTQHALVAVLASIPPEAQASQLGVDTWVRCNLKAVNDTIRQSTEYAVLSHTWDDEEFLFTDIQSQNFAKRGYAKFAAFCARAQEHGCRYAWMDSSCIASANASELDESIRSMFRWYRNSFVCLVVLASSPDPHLPLRERLCADRWFQRGWTLQELLAPLQIKFYWQDWSPVTDAKFEIFRFMFDPPPRIGLRLKATRHDQSDFALLAEAAGVDSDSLQNYRPNPAHARTVFGWLVHRKTTRPEDIAYCVLGLLDVQLPIAYGEGRARAFYRLQLECAQHTHDRNLFMWHAGPSRWSTMFAEDPQSFVYVRPPQNGLAIRPREKLYVNALFEGEDEDEDDEDVDPSFALSNYGMRISVVLLGCEGILKTSKVIDAITVEDSVCFGTLNRFSVVVDGAYKAEFSWKGPEASDKLRQKWRVGVLGTLKEEGGSLGTFIEEQSTAFAILLEPVWGSKRQYIRLASSRFYYTPSELEQDLETIFIL
ncbi:hypothetical protein EYR40_009936 [Pleurotus pulmonarius]|nr:hypothetical protein EYR40_009936 [Pleurotus pulmonarius]